MMIRWVRVDTGRAPGLRGGIVRFGLALVCLIVLASQLPLASAQSGILANVFGSRMVLQREPDSARLWGWASAAGEQVQVSVDHQVVATATANSEKKWIASLPPQPPGGPHLITVKGLSVTMEIDDVYFGDVWLCGGQDNMQMTVAYTENAVAELEAADKYPQIRLFTAGRSYSSVKPLTEFRSPVQFWSVASAAALDGKGIGRWPYFSGLCWLFGRELHDKLQVPIGLVSLAWAGSKLKQWSSQEAAAKCPHPDAKVTSTVWNVFMEPILDLATTGMIWYQGEADSWDAASYECGMREWILDWRSKSARVPQNRSAVQPFIFVQQGALPWGAHTEMAEFRAAQEKALKLPRVGMASAIDIYDYDDAFHPRDKKTIAHRLVQEAQHLVYGSPVHYQYPRALKAHAVGVPPEGKIVVLFETYSAGLIMKPSVCIARHCAGLEIQLSNGRWYRAVGVASASSTPAKEIEVVLLNRDTKAIQPDPKDSTPISFTGVRYGWGDWPECTIFSDDEGGLPALPFYIAWEVQRSSRKSPAESSKAIVSEPKRDELEGEEDRKPAAEVLDLYSFTWMVMMSFMMSVIVMMFYYVLKPCRRERRTPLGAYKRGRYSGQPQLRQKAFF